MTTSCSSGSASSKDDYVRRARIISISFLGRMRRSLKDAPPTRGLPSTRSSVPDAGARRARHDCVCVRQCRHHPRARDQPLAALPARHFHWPQARNPDPRDPRAHRQSAARARLRGSGVLAFYGSKSNPSSRFAAAANSASPPPNSPTHSSSLVLTRHVKTPGACAPTG